MFLGSGVFAFTINSIGIVLEEYNQVDKKFKKEEILITKYLKRKKYPLEL